MKVDKRIKFKKIKKSSNTLVLFTVIYILIVIMSIIGRTSTLEHTSTTEVTFTAVMKEFANPIIIIVMLVATIILYSKKEKFAIVLEYIIALSMVVNVLISVISVGFNILALLLSLVFPVILIIHASLAIIKRRKVS